MARMGLLVLLWLTSDHVMGSEMRCSDQDLKELGWAVRSSSRVQATSERLWNLTQESPDVYGDEAVYKMYSTVARNWVELVSVDSTLTPSDEMLGDILWIRDLDSQEVVEVRWYEGGRVKVQYDLDYQPCATNAVPMVTNSLY